MRRKKTYGGWRSLLMAVGMLLLGLCFLIIFLCTVQRDSNISLLLLLWLVLSGFVCGFSSGWRDAGHWLLGAVFTAFMLWAATVALIASLLPPLFTPYTLVRPVFPLLPSSLLGAWLGCGFARAVASRRQQQATEAS